MTSEEKMTMDRHSEALEAHTRALNNLTALLSGIFEDRNPLTHETTVHPLHRTLSAFIESATELSSRNCMASESNSETADKMYRAASVAEEAAEKMLRAASYNDEAADKMCRASYR